MKTRKRALTAQIKPATRNAIMDQLAVAAETIIALRTVLQPFTPPEGQTWKWRKVEPTFWQRISARWRA